MFRAALRAGLLGAVKQLAFEHSCFMATSALKGRAHLRIGVMRQVGAGLHRIASQRFPAIVFTECKERSAEDRSAAEALSARLRRRSCRPLPTRPTPRCSFVVRMLVGSLTRSRYVEGRLGNSYDSLYNRKNNDKI